MHTTWDTEAREALSRRVQQLSPSSTALWGRMSYKQMLAHLPDSIRMPLGQIEIRPR